MKLILKILLPVAVLLIGVAARNLLLTTGPQAEEQVPETYVPVIEVISLQPQDLELLVHAQGEVRPARQAMLSSEVAGRVLEVGSATEVGAFFAKGDLLLRIDDTDYRIAVMLAEAQLAQAAASLELELAQGEIAKRDWEEIGQGEAAPAALRIPQRRAAEAMRDAADAMLEKAQMDLLRCTVFAPFNGRTLRRSVELGGYVGPGTPLVEVYGTDAAEVVLPLPLKDLAFLPLDVDGATSQPVPVSLEATFGGVTRRWRGEIVRVEAKLDSRDRMLRAIARVESPYRGGAAALLPGMFVSATLIGRGAEQVYALPRAALRTDDHILLVDSEDRIHELAVEVVQRRRDVVLVSGLEPGARLCVTPLALVMEGMQVRVTAEAE